MEKYKNNLRVLDLSFVRLRGHGLRLEGQLGGEEGPDRDTRYESSTMIICQKSESKNITWLELLLLKGSQGVL